MPSRGVSMMDAPWGPDDVPAEIWMEIFEWLPSSADLYNVLLTCKTFCALTVRALHRDVTWHKPEEFAQDLPAWDTNQGMDAVTHSLKIGFSFVPPALNGWVVHLDGSSTYRWRNDLIGIDTVRLYNTVQYYALHKTSFASQPLYDEMFTRISSFTNLQNLTFYNVIFYNRHFALIHELPGLRTLRLELCVFPNRARSRFFDHSTLPITELTMLNLRRRIAENHGDRSVTVEEDIVHALSLATAQNLRILRIDSTADVFRNVFSGFEQELHDFTIPPHLEQLYVLRKRSLAGEVQPTFPGESTFPDPSLYTFLRRARTITTYSTYHAAAPHLLWAPESLPQLRHYAGPIETLAGITPERPIDALVLLRCGYGVRDGVTALAGVAQVLPDLEMLAVEFRTWDDEILHAVTTLFRKLRRLRIVCDHGGPSETTLVSIGPEFLTRLPHLHTLQMYVMPVQDGGMRPLYPTSMFDPSYTSVEEELQNLVIPWNRWCPSLREVQLLGGYVLRRGFDGGAWQVYKVARMPEWESFTF
ncbi:hypothetical protein BKA93DRAFT_807214 [Sparassis latifolia]|uniref:F-box domain-containing protein n=1 Tax=Sparassis crispa TaxID=139825 RepID=A0A401H4E5_9APHY|nr:predicted protein [Sparassis crispa]GBE89284.1 predicted protein [Sparassis crispa]